MEVWSWIQVVGAVFLGCVIQSAVGFGCSLFAVPILVWSGLSLPQSIALALTTMVVQTTWNLRGYWREVPWVKTLPLFGLRLAFLPVGIWLLTLLAGVPKEQIKAVVGLAVLIALVMQTCFQVRPRPSVHWGWTAGAGASSGLVTGLVGMGGPPIVLWVMAHDWPARTARAFIWAVFLELMPINVAMLAIKFGRPTAVMIPLGLAMTPVVLLAATLGARLGDKLSRRTLRLTATLLLVAIALSSIAAPFFRWAGLG
ncbi:MAG: sulfite exporter TauE/SafE family protein [Phycisphaeraceae bacterium]|nr:sulfite exporter TauE/SafE family protein [Phycisphaeraceae bacterium]